MHASVLLCLVGCVVYAINFRRISDHIMHASVLLCLVGCVIKLWGGCGAVVAAHSGWWSALKCGVDMLLAKLIMLTHGVSDQKVPLGVLGFWGFGVLGFER